jgi:putative aldouronate transport system permease protein
VKAAMSADALLREMQMDMMGDDLARKAFLAECMKYAVIIVSTLPVMCLYPLIQKYYLKG